MKLNFRWTIFRRGLLGLVWPSVTHSSRSLTHLLAESIHKHPDGRSGPDHEGRVAARVPRKVHLKLLGRLQQAGEEDVAEFVDVEQRGSLDAKLPYRRLDGGRSVLQKQLAGFGGLTCEDKTHNDSSE